MRWAILTDIHGNREALSAVLADLAPRGIDRIAVLGDVVGYGPDPGFCVDRVADLVAQGAVCVKGNHDSAIANRSESLNPTAQRVIDWTRDRLSQAQAGFLAGLPMSHLQDGTLFVHASANDPAGWIYVTSESKATGSFRATPARLILCGHVHVPLLVSCDVHGVTRGVPIPMGRPLPLLRSRRWLAVVGSVGQPRDRSPAAAYAILDTVTGELTFRRVPYDNATTARKLREAGLPESLAARLIRGE